MSNYSLESRGTRPDASFPNSPMLERIERDRKFRRIGQIAAAIAVAVLAAAAVGPVVFKLFGSHASDSTPLTACGHGDLDCLDDNFGHVKSNSNGSPDGCSLLTREEQLVLPLCCPGVAPDAENCPPITYEDALKLYEEALQLNN